MPGSQDHTLWGEVDDFEEEAYALMQKAEDSGVRA